MYRCRTCIIRASCSELCEEVMHDRNDLTEYFKELDYMLKFICPDCGYNNGLIKATGADIITHYCKGCGHVFSIYTTAVMLIDCVTRESLP